MTFFQKPSNAVNQLNVRINTKTPFFAPQILTLKNPKINILNFRSFEKAKNQLIITRQSFHFKMKGKVTSGGAEVDMHMQSRRSMYVCIYYDIYIYRIVQNLKALKLRDQFRRPTDRRKCLHMYIDRILSIGIKMRNILFFE